MQPLVSVILPVYNREDTIMRALNSVIIQSYYNMEVIVIDDGSTDATVQMVQSCLDKRVRLIRLPSNCGANTARNRGIEQAKGEYIAFQDSDDEWFENKLEKQIKYMQMRELSASYSPYLLYEDHKCHVVPRDYENYGLCEQGLKDILKTDNIVGTPTLIVKKDVFSVIGLFDEKMERMQDYEFVIRLVKEFRLGYIDEPLVKVYRMKKSISTNHELLADAYVRLLEKHADFLDLRKLLCDYYRCCDFSCRGELVWKDIDRIMTVVRKIRNELLEKECCKITIQYLFEQYDAVKGVFREWYLFYEEHIKTNEFVIYGAGVYGSKVYGDLKKKNCIPKYFLVTELGELSDIEGIPLISLEEFTERELPVVIAVSWKMQWELIKNLMDRGIDRFCVYPFCHSV